MSLDDDPITAAMFDFVEQWHSDVDRGQRHDVDYYLGRFPGHEDAIRAEFERLTAVQQDDDEVTAVGRRIGPYEILRELGRGGQGAVYLARDTRMAREVALKILPPAAFVAGARLRRFRREAEVVAGLSHPCICDVLEADFEGELPYIAMRFIPGSPLSSTIDGERPDRRAVRRSTELIVQVARALHIAHEAGVVHRDINPDNILVTPQGKPVILDFGLAREIDDASLTEPGSVMGTLHYMAPEQLQDKPASLDRRTDVHALAVTLYEMVTGERPFTGHTREVLALKIRDAEPKDPCALNAAVPVDLGVVIAKALEKDPNRRYPTALAFAQDLQRICDHEPILARPAGPMLRLRRWARRHPILSTSTALASLLLTVGLAVALVLLEQVGDERERYKGIFYATHARQLIDVDPAFAMLTAIEAAHIEPGFLANTALYETLEACREERRVVRSPRQRDITVDAAGLKVAMTSFDGICEVEDLSALHRAAWQVPFAVSHCAFDDSGRRLLAGGVGGEVAMFDAATGEHLLSLPRSPSPVSQVTYVPDADRIAAATEDGPVRLFDLASGRELESFGTAGSGTKQLAINADGTRLLALDPNGALRSYAIDADGPGDSPLSWERDAAVRLFALPMRGPLVALATEDDIELLDGESGRTLHRFVTSKRSDALAFDPTAERLAACLPGQFVIWSARDGSCLLERNAHREQTILDLAFAPDGRHLATGAVDSSVRVFSADDGELVHRFDSFGYHAIQVHFSPDGKRLISVRSNERVIVYRLDDRPGMLTLRGHDAGVQVAGFSPDGTRILSGSDDGTARIWDRLGRNLWACPPQGSPIVRTHWSPDGQRVLTLTANGDARLWQSMRDMPAIALAGGNVVDAWFDLDGRAVTLNASGSLQRWDHQGVETSPTRNVADARSVLEIASLTPRGDLLAVGHDRPEASLLPLEDGLRAHQLTFESGLASMPEPRVCALQFSRSGLLLAVGARDNSVHLFDTTTGRLRGRHSSSTPGCIAIAADDSLMLIGASFNPKISFLSIGDDSLDAVAVFGHHRHKVSACDFHPDGSMFLSSSYDGTVRLYLTEGVAKFAVLAGHNHAVTTAEFSPDGDAVLSASLDGTLRLWPVDPLALARQRLSREMIRSERHQLQRALAGN